MLEYDDSAFYYFSLTLVTFYVIPVTLSTIIQVVNVLVPRDAALTKARTEEEQEKLRLIRSEVYSARKLFTSHAFLFKLATLVAGWAAFYALVSTMDGGAVSLAQFDPYAILGIDVGVEPKAIKRAYRTLSLQYHPDKNPGSKMAEDMFMKIARAYQALTDPKSKENWEKYGNPDGKQSMAVSIALPTWLLDKAHHNSILILYLIAMVVVIPSLVAVWYAGSRKYGDNNILYDTYTWYNHMVGEKMHTMQVPEVLAGSAEYRKLGKPRKGELEPLKDLFKEMAMAPRDKVVLPRLKYEHPIILKGSVLLVAHTTRRPLPTAALRRDQHAILRRVPELVEAVVDLAVGRRWLIATVAAMDFAQCATQAVWVRDHPHAQLPHLTAAQIAKFVSEGAPSFRDFLANEAAAADAAESSANGSSSSSGGDAAAEPLVPPAKSLLKDMDAAQRRDVWAAVRALPDVLVDVKAYVDDEGEIAEGDLVTIKVTITRQNLREGETCPPAFAPHYPGARQEGWWVMLASVRSSQVLACQHVTVTDRVTETELKLMAPNRPSKVQLDILIKSDCYRGLDRRHELEFDVVSASTLPVYEPHPDDLELDDEPTLFEQVMQGYSESDSDEEDEAKTADAGAAAAGGDGGDDDDDDDEEESDED
eukprot:TRINITY_DN3090_c0_g2_i1.p1 TRINITY_DN3090_c0_g2~~TRINITY_DN3090_c0_g2_i1.p1  ORF type:complete len:649 (-),score=300.82 TRINITY_DN3090_c0_g2_i1:64-2010(-)